MTQPPPYRQQAKERNRARKGKRGRPRKAGVSE